MKRRSLRALLDASPVVAFQETRGVAADLRTLPTIHEFVGLLAEEDRPGSMRRGGAIGVSVEMLGAARTAEVVVHMRARAMSISLENNGWAHFARVYIDLGQTLRAWRQFGKKVGSWRRSRTGYHFLTRAWKSFTSEEVRTRSDGLEAKAPDSLASHIGYEFSRTWSNSSRQLHRLGA